MIHATIIIKYGEKLMIKIPHLRDCYRVAYRNRVPIENWQLPNNKLFWANKFNIWQIESGVSTLPFNFVVAGNHPNKLDVLIVRLGDSTILNYVLTIGGKALIKLLNLL